MIAVDKTEALAKLTKLAEGGLIPMSFSGPNGPGRELRRQLGLNSIADMFYGFRLNVSVSEKSQKLSLFGKVPIWSQGTIQSSHDLLEKFGTRQSGDPTLYCTMTVGRPNSHGLYLTLSEDGSLLQSRHINTPDAVLCAWRVDQLYATFVRKYQNVLEISVDLQTLGSRKYLLLKTVKVLQDPTGIDFAKALRLGYITVDHLISLDQGLAHEHGPLFRIERQRFLNLYPGFQSVRFAR